MDIIQCNDIAMMQKIQGKMWHVASKIKIVLSIYHVSLIEGPEFGMSEAANTVPFEYISHRVMPYDQASVFSLYVGTFLLRVSSVSGANHFIGTDVCYRNDI